MDTVVFGGHAEVSLRGALRLVFSKTSAAGMFESAVSSVGRLGRSASSGGRVSTSILASYLSPGEHSLTDSHRLERHALNLSCLLFSSTGFKKAAEGG